MRNSYRSSDANGNIVASYTYDAFGKLISKSGPLADFFRHRFSTKYFDAEPKKSMMLIILMIAFLCDSVADMVCAPYAFGHEVHQIQIASSLQLLAFYGFHSRHRLT